MKTRKSYCLTGRPVRNKKCEKATVKTKMGREVLQLPHSPRVYSPQRKILSENKSRSRQGQETRTEGSNTQTRYQIETTRKPDRKEEERRNNRKYVRVVLYCSVCIIHAKCTNAFTQYNICVDTLFHK